MQFPHILWRKGLSCHDDGDVIYFHMYMHPEGEKETDKGSEPVMMKKILCLVLLLAMCAVLPASAETAKPVTATELDELLAGVRTAALAAELLNDPENEEAQNEDGTLFHYEVAKIYAAAETFAADTPVNALVISGSEDPVFRGLGIDSLEREVLAAFPNENPELTGTREEAILFLTVAEGGFTYGRIRRDGQRVTAAEYGEVLPAGEQFRWAAVTFYLQDGLVTSIRADGLNPGEGLMDASYANEFLKELEALSAQEEYRAVKTSVNGLDLEPFGEEDLIFSGIAYPALQPGDLPGEPEQELIDNEDGTWLLCFEETGYEAVFRCDKNGENAEILSFSIRDEGIEGPRCVRLGDLFSDDFRRFRNGENEMDEDLTEVLYGTEGGASWGFASYDPADMSLRYVTSTEGGLQVMLILRYEDNYLTEIMLQTI